MTLTNLSPSSTANLRNIAIIAHVDHGKTTLVDEIMKQCHLFREGQEVIERMLDSNDLERERGITIRSKNIAVNYGDTRINIIDTPGHSDFGGEVERVLKMADGVLLLVDAFEGPMPQTRFVLQKALQLHLRPIVVINKVDREGSRPLEVQEEVLDLFIELDADDEQLEFPTVYAAGRDGWAIAELKDERKDLTPLLEMIVEHIPAPVRNEGPVQMLCTALDHSDYVGRIGIGRVFRGCLKVGEPVAVIKRDGSSRSAMITQLFLFEGLGRREVAQADCGDICAVVGLADVEIGDTLADPLQPDPLPLIAMDEPTLTMSFLVNTSPFFGKEGRYCSSRHLRERLFKETERDMALRVENTSSPDEFKVSGRGILHLSILMENMRREGYEFMVGQPRVIYKEINGKKAEPVEVLTVDVAAEHAGTVIEHLGTRRAEMMQMVNREGRSLIKFHVPSRGLIGFRSRMLQATSGEIVLNHRFLQYEYFKGSIPQRQTGSIISMAQGPAVPFALDALQSRGRFFIEPGDKLYIGQVIGESPKEGDIVVNAQKTKKLTNMRAAASDRSLKVAPAAKMSLEDCLEHVGADEYVEVTPASIRMRKALLDVHDRKRSERASAKLEVD
ncbi:MAG: translational GTPase TypA [Candidatus Eisenbacteria bacterium]|uniref:Large ribosomal subunit assembly factor BipA n=1 Tax=Eiseniibacteriota bacterium TaxID=2212470 RepID=A0A948W846_UNCEI|nr:translational GTPase TypA [Candidatus Eisenbacteria bacterium]MBU2692321.1 translational GTPase TypA [Candidatus Eisenbacteria bacterium]